MRFYIDRDGIRKRCYKINPPLHFRSPVVGVAADGRQVIADYYAGPRHLGDQPLEPSLVAHWFSANGDFLDYERQALVGHAVVQMQAWMAALGVVEGPVEVKKFACESGMYILDPMVDVDEYDAEYDFDYARERGIFHLYWQGESYICRADGRCGK